MTDYETLAALGFTEPAVKSSEAAPLLQPGDPHPASVARGDVEFPSRRSLRSAAPVTAPDAAPTVSAPARPGSRRAVREARVAAESVPPVASAPSVAAPFGTFDVPPALQATRRSMRDHGPASSAPRVSPATASVSTASVRTSSAASTRKRLSAAGTMVLVGGLFVSLTLPAYAATDLSGDAAEKVVAATGSQTLALDDSAVEAAGATEARDGYDSTSAADLRRMYRDALREQRMAEYLASGAKELGDDYPWAGELGMSQGGGLSPLRYFVRQCTDFVAWRLNRDAGSTSAPFKYDWSYLTPGGGSAHSWKSQWERHGWAISTTPAPGWVAWFPGGNHVAYVNSVLADGSVFIEEYNWGPDIYNQRIINASDAIYLSPPPR